MELPSAMIMGVDQVRRRFAECAPDAPARPEPVRAGTRRRFRRALAGGLIRLAHAIAPPEPVCR
ncbi:hypothetical protein [Paractinoplanes lichenicola]|uniref:Uncharacterized protein n=1 Tax=Paractinoplanes lichenicola TaxID=2802976 RepID=A0ABS1W0H2_9ACTN|nr:hypothetical protein [Actinoplanes lichenicola]MBL7260188.1 hypothetical protein [Actinoplanes lichenicola]